MNASTTKPRSEPLSWKTEKRRIGDLKPWTGNPRSISPKDRRDLEESIARYGYVEIVAINLDDEILAGHQRVAALIDMGREDEVVDVRVPSRALTREEATEYNLRSNKNVGEWDWELLGDIEEPVLLEAGFTEAELSAKLPSEGPSTEEMAESSPKLRKFLDSRAQSKVRGQDKAEVNHWVCLVFQSWAQKTEFLERIGNPETEYGMYADGQTIAQAMGIDVTPNTQKPMNSPMDGQLTSLSMDEESADVPADNQAEPRERQKG